MREKNSQKDTLNELWELQQDIEEWLLLLEEKARSDQEAIWAEFNTRKIIELTEELLRDFESYLSLANDKKEAGKYKKKYIRFKTEISFYRKEYLS